MNERHRLPHACLLCAPVALPFRNLWEARRHVREAHEIGDAYPEEFLRILDESAFVSEPDIRQQPPFICLHCRRTGRFELRNTPDDMDVHYKNMHLDRSQFDRMGISRPDAVYEADYLSDADFKQREAALIERFILQLESIDTTTDLFVELRLDFFRDAPEGAEGAEAAEEEKTDE